MTRNELSGRARGRLATRFWIVWITVTTATVLTAGSGCTSLRRWAHQGFRVGPDYARPPAPFADEWIDYQNADVDTSSEIHAAWWTVLGDAKLNELIDRASRQNLSLQAAGMRILEARARLAVARGNLFPQLQEAFGGFQRFNQSSTTANALPVLNFDNWDLGLSAAWELDFWGRFRRAIETQEAILDAEIENYDDVLVLLQAEVATAYVQYRTFQERLKVARYNVELQQRTVEIVEVQFKNGRVTELDLAQAKENLAATRSVIPEYEARIRQTANAICVLLGEPPRDLSAELGEGAIPEVPHEILVGIPADLLRRRPDVRRAERRAAAQSAVIGIAESEFYPHIAITGSVGLASADLSDLFRSDSFTGAIGPSFQWNILNYGRILNNVRAEEAGFYQAVYDYQNTVLTAAQEVEDGIVAYLKTREQVEAVDEAAAQALRAVEVATTQYRRGRINFQPVVYMQQILAQRQDQLAATRGSVVLSLINVYKALGGGWEARLQGGSAAAVPQPGPEPQPQPPAQPGRQVGAPRPQDTEQLP